MEEVSKGYRLPKPEGCPYEVYRLMIECWDSNVKVYLFDWYICFTLILFKVIYACVCVCVCVGNVVVVCCYFRCV